MAQRDFHGSGFDEGTLTKLELFELYLREWLPVFLASGRPLKKEIHVFDFFAGPGESGRGEPGSPLRVLRQLKAFEHLPGWPSVSIHAHFFDAKPTAIEALRSKVEQSEQRPVHVNLDLRALPFETALTSCARILQDPNAAKLLFIDQFGVDAVTEDVFRRIVSFPTSDFLFFLTSSTLHRFRDHPAIKQKIAPPDDYYKVHRAALQFYRDLLPDPAFFLAPFSIKKGANIYGLIFGSAHPLGIDKFLQVAWKSDEINGEANFDINRDNLSAQQPMFPTFAILPKKITAFESDLELRLRAGDLRDELEVARLCFEHGVKRQHAAPVLLKLKKEGILEAAFQFPSIATWRTPRPVRLRR